MGLDLGLERAPMGSPDALRRPLGRPPESPAGAILGVGRVAQRQSASLTRRRSQVQPLPRPPGGRGPVRGLQAESRSPSILHKDNPHDFLEGRDPRERLGQTRLLERAHPPGEGAGLDLVLGARLIIRVLIVSSTGMISKTPVRPLYPIWLQNPHPTGR